MSGDWWWVRSAGLEGAGCGGEGWKREKWGGRDGGGLEDEGGDLGGRGADWGFSSGVVPSKRCDGEKRKVNM